MLKKHIIFQILYIIAGVCREFLRGRGSNVKKRQYDYKIDSQSYNR